MSVYSSNAQRIPGDHSLRSRRPSLGSEAQPQAKRPSVVMRKFEVASLQPDGYVRHAEHIGPAIPMFEAAFSAFAHGAIVTTTQGPVAIEDLEPGMKLITRDHGSQRLLWVGKMKIVPKFAETTAHDARMTRIMADSFGFTRPERDLTAGPGARMLKSGAVMSDQDPVLVPVNQLSDGMSVIDIVPPSPVDVYHVCLPRHAAIMVNGLDMETFHPGNQFQQNMGEKMLSLFLSLFPHISEPEDFGTLNYERDPLVAPNGLEVA